MDISPPVIAGVISTFMFGTSMLPMLTKAFRTRDLRSYSLGNILLSNAGNAVHSIYVFSLPPGPIWLLHTFHLLTTALMLLWYLRYEARLSISIGGLAMAIERAGSVVRRDPRIVPVPDVDASLPGERAA